MVNATSQCLDPEVAALARSRARIPRVKLEYPRPKPITRGPFDTKVTKTRRSGKAAKKQQPTSQKCMWKELPLELRYKIYEEACSQGSHVTVDSTAARQWETPFKFPHPEGARAYACLLRTCKSIYDDLRSYPPFYKNKHFEFDEPLVLHNFVRATPEWARQFITHVDLEPRRVMVNCPGNMYHTSSAFQVLIGARDVPATAPDPGAIVAALPEVLPRLKQLRIIFSWHTARSLGVVPVAKHVIRELTAIPDLRNRVPGKHHHHAAMVPKRDDFTFGFMVAVKFENWMEKDKCDRHKEKMKRKEVYHKWCVHCFINEFRSRDGPVKKYGGRLRNILKGVEWCVSTEDHRPFRKEAK
ncbi:hypothetical protein PG996_009298 [Apiospora saccharicola]|uniref:Uncharacterized protein n=1 Tax=Apiospora saccharicola TaxID=335842 RepID=A0ABR1UKC8_9PEZI